MSRLATSKFSIFYIASVAEETGLSLSLSETPKTGFVATRPILYGPRREETCLRGLGTTKAQTSLRIHTD